MATRTLEFKHGKTFQLEDDEDYEIDGKSVNRETIDELKNVLDEQCPNINEILDEQDIRSDIKNDILSHSDHVKDYDEPVCYFCSKRVPLTSGHDIKQGMHFIRGRFLPWGYGNDKVQVAMEFITKKLGCDQCFLYEHHAIVSEVIETHDDTAKVKLIEFTTTGSSAKCEIIESKEPITITIGDNNQFYRHYEKKRYSPQEIVDRARTRIGESTYQVLFNNCEHFAVWCMSGETKSDQADEVIDKSLTSLSSWAKQVMGKMCSAVVSLSDEFYVASRIARYAYLAMPIAIFSGIFVLFELLSSIIEYINLKQMKRQDKICHKYFNRKKTYLISRIVSFSVATFAFTLISAFTFSPVATLGFSICFSIVSVFVLPYLFSFLYRKVKKAINPLYDVQKVLVRDHRKIVAGDILTIPHNHDVIVKSVRYIHVLTNGLEKVVQLRIIHIAWNFEVNWIRTVFEELLPFDLEHDQLKIRDVPESESFKPEEVVKNAKQKLGEQNFNPFWYRSSHMSKFCKVKNYRYKYYWSLNSVPITKRNVKKVADVQLGDMVEYNYYGFPHAGIITEILASSELVEIEYYHVDGVVTLDKKTFDLSRGKIFRHKYPKENCNAKEEILQRAEANLGKWVYLFRPYRSSRFVRDCIKKEND